MKLYRVVDLQGCNFMDDTSQDPQPLNKLRHRFWCLDDTRTAKYNQFTKDFIQAAWDIKFELVK